MGFVKAYSSQGYMCATIVSNVYQQVTLAKAPELLYSPDGTRGCQVIVAMHMTNLFATTTLQEHKVDSSNSFTEESA